MEVVKGKHWVKREELCLPQEEGGLGFRSLNDISRAFFAKLWWIFRTSITSIWGHYIWNKCCKKDHPCIARALGGSQVWKKMIEIREEVEHEIGWKLKARNSSFWIDNWTPQLSLYFIEDNRREQDWEVKEFIADGGWDVQRLQGLVSEEMATHITHSFNPLVRDELTDAPIWMPSYDGRFSTKTAYELLRRKRQRLEWMDCIWVKGLPFKISFFQWRVWKRRLPTDDNLQRMHINVVSKCYCCEEHKQETMAHLFLTSSTTQKLWKFFASCAGFTMDGLQLQQMISKWWRKHTNPKL